MPITSKLTRGEIININFIMVYRKAWMKIYTGVMILLLLASIVGLFIFHFDLSLAILFFSFMVISTPLIICFGAVINFKARNTIPENINYNFTMDHFSVTGESFMTQLSWNKISEVIETQNWILIMQTKQAACIIRKKDVDEDQITELKNILNNKKIKNNLKIVNVSSF